MVPAVGGPVPLADANGRRPGHDFPGMGTAATKRLVERGVRATGTHGFDEMARPAALFEEFRRARYTSDPSVHTPVPAEPFRRHVFVVS